MVENPNIVYYADWKLLQQNPAIIRPINAVFLTSVRDTGTCDRNGSWVETGNGLGYMEGVIERTVRETLPSGSLADIVRVVGVITDDSEKDMRSSSYSALPDPDRDWIFPFELQTPDGCPVREMTYNIPTTFRSLPLSNEEERRRLKREFERTLLQRTQELGGDIIVSDHYMARIDYLFAEFGLFGRVLNIHPAVTVEGHPFCFRGKTPTADAIDCARREGLIRTGATLHIIDTEIDKGPPIAYTAETPVFPTDEPQWLRYRNYRDGKLPLFIAGLAHYARAIYPYFGKINLRDLQPLSTEEVLHSSREA